MIIIVISTAIKLTVNLNLIIMEKCYFHYQIAPTRDFIVIVIEGLISFIKTTYFEYFLILDYH